MDWWWRRQLDDEGLDVLIHEQQRIVSRAQLLAAGRSDSEIRRRLRGRRWQTVHPGVYATHTGPLGYYEQLVAALLYAGPEVAWSHYTAAEQFGVIKPDERRPVYVSVPWRRRVRGRPGIVITRDKHWEDRLAAGVPPRSRPAEAVLEIVGIAGSLDDAAAIVAEACQSSRVRPAEILSALDGRPQLRHRAALRSSSSSNWTGASTSRLSSVGGTSRATIVRPCGPKPPCDSAGSTSPATRVRPPSRSCRRAAARIRPSQLAPVAPPARSADRLRGGRGRGKKSSRYATLFPRRRVRAWSSGVLAAVLGGRRRPRRRRATPARGRYRRGPAP